MFYLLVPRAEHHIKRVVSLCEEGQQQLVRAPEAVEAGAAAAALGEAGDDKGVGNPEHEQHAVAREPLPGPETAVFTC